jgi:hypothetical protein
LPSSGTAEMGSHYYELLEFSSVLDFN